MTEQPPSRIDRLREVHQFLHPGHCRAMLCYQSKLALQDPAIHGDMDNLQLRLEVFVDVMRRSSEDEVRNELAKTLEWFPELNPDEVSSDDEKQAYIDYLKGQ
jgi:alpha-L-fucosidase